MVETSVPGQSVTVERSFQVGFGNAELEQVWNHRNNLCIESSEKARKKILVQHFKEVLDELVDVAAVFQKRWDKEAEGTAKHQIRSAQMH